MCVCVGMITKTTALIITILDRWIVRDNSWSPILFEVKRSNVKVSMSESSALYIYSLLCGCAVELAVLVIRGLLYARAVSC